MEEVSNHGCADGAASVENNGYMGGKCREAAAEGEGALIEESERGALMSGRGCS